MDLLDIAKKKEEVEEESRQAVPSGRRKRINLFTMTFTWNLLFFVVTCFLVAQRVTAVVGSGQDTSVQVMRDVPTIANDDAFSNIVSFFGSSHVSMRLQEARSTSDIYFRLRTRRADSMLFLAAGRIDYCLLVLDAGRLKVHINLGAGETEIASEAPFLLNDMKWHSVNLTRRGSQLTIEVDNHFTKANLPSNFHDLNIHFGIWLGGLSGFNEIFLGNLPSFRGCMSHITYNAEDVLLRAKTQLGQISGVSWSCSEEFDATTKDTMGFMSANSYVISRVAISRLGTLVKMNVRPMEDHGLILYVSGMSSRPDYLALELHSGKVRLTAEMGSGPLQVQSSVTISDGQWHSVAFRVSPSLLSVMVDNGTWLSEPPMRGGSRHLDVSELVYLGIEDTRRGKLRSQGLLDQSFIGCIKDLHLDDKAYGLPQVDVSSNITKGCSLLEEQYCLSAGTDIRSGSSSGTNNTNASRGSNSKCKAGSGDTAPNFNGTTPTSTTTKTKTGPSPGSSNEVISIARDVIRIVTQTEVGELEIMRVTGVQVAEGDSIIISPRHLAVTLDLSKFGIRESGVLFRVSKPPQQGRLEFTLRSASSTGSGSSSVSASGGREETFSLLDVGAGRVRYWHNGAENSRDSIELVLRLVQTTGFLLPAYLQDERVLTLPVEITAVNDPPEIRLVPGGVLRLAHGTKVRLMPEVITSLDPDTVADDLQFSIVSMGTAADSRGYLELSTNPGKPIQFFSQADLQNGHVWYVDGGLSSSKMAVKVTDGSSVSTTAVLRIETFSLRIAPEVNTGVEVANVMGTAAVITSTNLSFTSNAAEQGLIVEYHVISPPKAGILQLRRSNGQWLTADHFTQLDLQAARLRYLLQRPSDVATEDEFSFHVSLSETKVPSEFRFRLRIVSLRLDQVGSNALTLNGTVEMPLSTRSLEYRTYPLSTSDDAILYTITQSPRLGQLLFRTTASFPTSPSNSSGHSILSFTQGDLVAKRVLYQFKYTPFSPMSDFFLFNVSTTHLDITMTSGPFRCDVHHFTRRKPMSVNLKPLIVMEGGRESISSKILRIRIGGYGEEQVLIYNITYGPKFGYLEKERDSVPSRFIQESSYITSSQVDQFTSTDLDKSLLFYTHDGSETPRDKIELVAWSSAANFMFLCQLDIMMRGVNNHPPSRAPHATLSVNVVFGGMRRLSNAILDYIDADWDNDRSSLKYSLASTSTLSNKGKSSPIGHVYDRSASLSTPIFQWTQADVDAGKLVFKHEGSDSHGSLPYWVTDSKFLVNGTLEISAGDAWLRIVNTSILAAKRGSMARLTDESIRIETNLDVDQVNILIRILQSPQHGIITVNETEVRNFSLGQMGSRLVFYQNKAVTDVQRDGFRFEAVVDGVAQSSPNNFDIAIYPEAYWSPLQIGANVSVVVNENSSAIISQTCLHIINPHIPPTDIVYTLTRPPRHGYLAVDPSHSNEETEDYVTMWDQTVINDSRLRYVQSEPNKTHDSMQFDVTNGVQTLRDLRLDFIVIPNTLLLASATIIVNEGNSIVLNVSHLRSAQNYFADKLWEIRVTKGAEHGMISLQSQQTQTSLDAFQYKALQDGKIIYSHDGSETLEDQFTVIAVAHISDSFHRNNIVNRMSPPHTVHVKVIPTNDQVPRVVNNTGTWVWTGSSTTLTNQQLAAVDRDSDETHLVYYVVETSGGYPAFKSQPKIPLQNFTQAHINQSQIIFQHKGSEMKDASFEFEVSDGLNEAEKETFQVTVRKPQLEIYGGRVPLPVFPLTQAPIKPENLLVRSSDSLDINFQVVSGPSLGQLLIEETDNNFVPVTSFTQSDVNSGKIFFEHLKASRTQQANDTIHFTASSKHADSLAGVTMEVEISVSGAALGGLQRYVVVQPLTLDEGSQVALTNKNINYSAVADFISVHQRGIAWRGGTTPNVKLSVWQLPKYGWLIESQDQRRLSVGSEISPAQLSSESVLYHHDDSESTNDQVALSLWLYTASAPVSTSTSLSTSRSSWPPTVASYSSSTKNTKSGSATDEFSSTWLLNLTLPIHINPVNDQPFQIAAPKGPITPVVQEHWRKLSRNDLLTSDPDTPPAHIVYEVTKISHGRLVLLINTRVQQPTTISSANSMEIENVKELPTISQFTQADIDGGKVIFYHSGVTSPVSLALTVSDGKYPVVTIGLTIPVQTLTLQASQSQSSPVRIQQGNQALSLSVVNLPASTNGHLIRLAYNVTRFPLHGKVLLRDRSVATARFSHYDLLRGEVAYVQTDLSVANDSFEVSAHFNEPEIYGISTSWLVNVVSVPLLKRVKEVRSFIKGFAVGGLLAPEQTEFSASYSVNTVLNLAVLDASPLAAVTGANPIYEVLLPPKYGQLYKIPVPNSRNMKPNKVIPSGSRLKRHSQGRLASRFSHEDVRRGAIIYTPELTSNDIIPSGPSSRSSSVQADEFIFKVLAPGVQPAIGIAKFNIHYGDGAGFFDEKNEISDGDGSTGAATTRRGDGSRSAFNDLADLVTPHMTKDSLITVGIIVAGVLTLSLFLVVGIRCSCASKQSNNQNQQQHRRRNSNGFNNTGVASVGGGVDSKSISNGMGLIDAYAPSTACTMIDPCHSDSDTGLRPLMMSTLSPRASRHKVSHSRAGTATASDSGSWTSSGIRGEMRTPSVPQCRVTPLCNSSDSGGYVSPGNGNVMCPLLPQVPPTPICDTFTSLPEEIDSGEPYGFTYGNLPPPLPLDIPLDFSDQDLNSYPSDQIPMMGSLDLNLPITTINSMNMAHLNAPSTTNSSCPSSSGASTSNSNNTGTLKKQPAKNQYWV